MFPKLGLLLPAQEQNAPSIESRRGQKDGQKAEIYIFSCISKGLREFSKGGNVQDDNAEIESTIEFQKKKGIQGTQEPDHPYMRRQAPGHAAEEIVPGPRQIQPQKGQNEVAQEYFGEETRHPDTGHGL